MKLHVKISRRVQGNNEGARLNLNSQQARAWSPNEMSQYINDKLV